MGSREMAQQLRVPAALPENPNSVLRNQTGSSQLPLAPTPDLFWSLQITHTHTYIEIEINILQQFLPQAMVGIQGLIEEKRQRLFSGSSMKSPHNWLPQQDGLMWTAHI